MLTLKPTTPIYTEMFLQFIFGLNDRILEVYLALKNKQYLGSTLMQFGKL
jgi:hypothetical protein